MRIAVILASSGIEEVGREDRRRYLQAVVSPGTTVDLIPNPAAPDSIESAFESDWAAVHVADRAVEVERAGYDAAVIWCGADPGIEGARERVAIPIVGPSDASLSIARQLGRKFSIITSAGSTSHVERRIWTAMLSPMLASVEIVDIPVLEIRRDLQATLRATQAAIEAASAKGAHAFVIGCMAMYGMARQMTKTFGVPVIDGGEAAVLTAEMLLKMGLSHSKIAFPVPPKIRCREASEGY